MKKLKNILKEYQKLNLLWININWKELILIRNRWQEKYEEKTTIAVNVFYAKKGNIYLYYIAKHNSISALLTGITSKLDGNF